MKSIIDDLRNTFQFGNMVMRLIIINVGIFVLLALTKAVTIGFGVNFHNIISWIAIPSGGFELLTRPWTIITHMFSHVGFSHILMNMLCLYWFGRIVGDLIGDKHILPVYILGGLSGALLFVVVTNILAFANVTTLPLGSLAYGASAAVSALVILAGLVAPDYEMNLFIIGRVRLKYIVAAIIFFYILGIFGSNSGGNIGHIGGILFGWLYFSKLGQKDFDMTKWFDRLKPKSKKSRSPKSPLKVSYKREANISKKETMTVDSILEKIQKVGVEGLTKREKDFLDQQSKK